MARMYSGGDTLNKRAIEVGRRWCSLGAKCAISNGSSIIFFSDQWIGNGPLRRLIHGLLLEGEDNINVRDFLRTDGSWDFNGLPFELSKSLQNLILRVPRQSILEGQDTLFCALSSSGYYYTRSASEFIGAYSKEWEGGLELVVESKSTSEND